jgi:hypothetical protein
MPFAAVVHLDEGLSLDTLLTLEVETSLICLLGTRRPIVSITERQMNLFLKTLKINKFPRSDRPE